MQRTSTQPNPTPDEPALRGDPSPPQREPWGWTTPQRIGMGLLLLAGLSLVGYQWWRRPYRLHDPVTLIPGQTPQLEQRVNPNTADVATLLLVPGLDEKWAQAIVDYREEHKTQYGGTVYQNIADLRSVRLGRTRMRADAVERMRPFLTFPGDATQPAPPPHRLTPARPLPDTAPAEDADPA